MCIRDSAETVDAKLWEATMACMDLRVEGEELGYVKRRASLPIKHKGLGLRRHVDIYPMAFLGSLEQAVPHFARREPAGTERGMRPALAVVLGDNSFAKGATEQWLPLLRSGARTGRELHAAFRRFKDAACLLYTSPSPRDRQKSRMPSSA